MERDAEALRARLLELGFDVVRFARADDTPGHAALERWLEQGFNADMDWMRRSVEKRRQPQQVLPAALSLILLGVNYGKGRSAEGWQDRPVWARYAEHVDYHDTIKAGLVAAGQIVEAWGGIGPQDYRYYVDTGPVSERAWAARAGVGFIGKNAMLISREFGNWLFLAAILVRADLPPDPPISAQRTAGVGLLCGKCTRCLEACPTQALPEPGVVDARRCISYQTIENKGIIPRGLRRAIGARVYGCDTCLEVCPWNRFAQDARSVLLQTRDLGALTLAQLLELTPETFAATFKGTAVKRLKLRGLLRNACIVAANQGETELLPTLVRLAAHPEPVVRAHAVWAVQELGGEALLVAVRATETDPRVLDEYDRAGETAPSAR